MRFYWMLAFVISAPIMADQLPFRVGVLAGGESWHYSLSSIRSKIYPGVTGQVEWWGNARWGLSGELATSTSLFRMKAIEVAVPSVQDIWMQQLSCAATGIRRFHVSSSMALGLSFGYRFWGSFSDEQKFESKTYTQVPSFNAHAVELGGEWVWLPSKRDIEAKLSLSVMPFVRYREGPDMPGEAIWPLGFAGTFRLRMFFDENWFTAFEMRGTGLHGDFVGDGTRIRESGEKYRGGPLLMLAFGASLGLGYAF